MKDYSWRILAALVILIAVVSYLLLFRSDFRVEPVFGMPSKFVIGIAITIILVAFTFIGQAIFPYSDLTDKENE